MIRSTSRSMIVTLATAWLLVVAGSAVADTVYPPTPPVTTVLPTAEPAEVTPAAEVAPAVDEAPASAVLGERLAVGGADLAVLAAVAAAAMAAGLVLVRSSRRRRSAADTSGR